MALNKITSEDLNGKGVIGLPDTPQLSTSEMQNKFEEISKDVIVPKFNELVDELEGVNGASNIGSNSGTVQGDIDTLATRTSKAMTDSAKAVTDAADALSKATQATSESGQLATEVANLKTDNTTNKAKITALETDNTNNKGNISTLQGNVSTLQSNVTSLQSEDTAIKGRVTTLETDNTSNKSKISSLESDNTTNKSDISNLKTKTTELDGLKHSHSNKSVIDALSKDSDGDLNFEGQKIKGGGASSWEDLTDKPFESIDEDTIYTEDGVLKAKQIEVDDTLSTESTNPVQNKVITEALDNVSIDIFKESDGDLNASCDGYVRSMHLLGEGRKSKNLITPRENGTTLNGITFSHSEDYKWTISGTSTARAYYYINPTIGNWSVNLKLENGDYIFSCKGLATEKVNVSLSKYLDSTWKGGEDINSSSVEERRFTVDNNVINSFGVFIDVREANIPVNDTLEIMIRKADITDDTYEPYGLITSEGIVESANSDNTKTSTINASEILNSTFTGVNDIKDELIVNADGSGKFIKRVGKKLGKELVFRLNGAIPDGMSYATNIVDKANGLENFICTNFTTKAHVTYLYCASGRPTNNVVAYNSDLTVLSEFNTMMANEAIIYELAEPIITDLTPSQVSALLSLKTFTDYTKITSDCEYELGYYVNSEIGQSIADVNSTMWNMIRGLLND